MELIQRPQNQKDLHIYALPLGQAYISLLSTVFLIYVDILMIVLQKSVIELFI